MKPETKTKRKVRSKYTDEFKAGAVRLVAEGRTPTQVAHDLGIHPASVYNWVRQAAVDSGSGPAGALTTDEKAELAEDFESAADLKRQAFDCIEVFYNQQRMHSALGDQSPAE